MTGDHTYYERPVIKEPVWIWAVPAYFYVGGVAGGAALLGATLQLKDRRGLARLIRRCRRMGAAGTTASTALLIYDLGRPERFLNMLRVFRPTSPMSVGSWILASTSGLLGTAAILDRDDGPLGALGDLAGLGAGTLAGPLSGYTAVLISDTAVPAWQHGRRSLPWLFAATSASGAAALLELAELDDEEQRLLARFGLIGHIGELAAAFALQREVARVPGAGRAYEDGLAGSLLNGARWLTVGAIGLSLLGRHNKIATRTGAVLSTAAALGYKFGVFHAGKASARDPKATFEAQRAGHGGRELAGQAGSRLPLAGVGSMGNPTES